MLKKNEIIRLEISGMTNEGNGVGKHEGIAVFVPFTVIGDVIECRISQGLQNVLLWHYRKYCKWFG